MSVLVDKGTKAEEGRKLLDGSGLNLVAAADLGDAAQKIVDTVGEAA